MRRSMGLFVQYCRDKWRPLGFVALCAVIFVGVFVLYHDALDAVLYAGLLCFAAAMIIVTLDFRSYYKKHCALKGLQRMVWIPETALPKAKTLIESDYQVLMGKLQAEFHALQSETERVKREQTEYFTLWTHQIKTPLSALRLYFKAAGVDDMVPLQKLAEMEQYADMALQYLRLESMSGDLVLHSVPLDQVIAKAVKAISVFFVYKKIRLCYEPVGESVLTDEKWLCFALTQILSNAVKYTEKGGTVSIYLDPDSAKTIVVADTGAGISQEDLPRIFERGFTGYNGRMDKKSTGLGLYLTKQILDRLNHTIAIFSERGAGTTVKINCAHRKLEIE